MGRTPKHTGAVALHVHVLVPDARLRTQARDWFRVGADRRYAAALSGIVAPALARAGAVPYLSER